MDWEHPLFIRKDAPQAYSSLNWTQTPHHGLSRAHRRECVTAFGCDVGFAGANSGVWRWFDNLKHVARTWDAKLGRGLHQPARDKETFQSLRLAEPSERVKITLDERMLSIEGKRNATVDMRLNAIAT